MDMAELARRQLGTALYLFLNDLDSISVHSLACGGGELSAGVVPDFLRRTGEFGSLDAWHRELFGEKEQVIDL